MCSPIFNGSPGTGNQVLGDLEAGSNITWQAVNSPYQVMGNLNIPSGTMLTIDAGVEVWMSSGDTVNVDGVLIVNGIDINPVHFTEGNMTSSPADWEGIRLVGVSNDNSTLSYCHIENAKQPLYMEDCSPEITYCTFTAASSTSHVVRLLRSNAHIQHSILSSTFDTDKGLYCESSSPVVEYNEIRDRKSVV